MMEADTLQLILDTAEKANGVEILNIEGDGRTKHVRIGERIESIAVAPKPRDHTVCSVDSLIRHAADYNENGMSTIWYSEKAIAFFPDDSDRRDKTQLVFKTSDKFELLKGLYKEHKWLDQLTFVRLLRLRLGFDPTFVAKFRRLAWGEGSKTTGEFVHGNDKMGRSINAQVENAADIPETVDVQMALYEEFTQCQVTIKCAIEIDSRNQQLLLAPLPGEIEKAERATMAELYEVIATSAILADRLKSGNIRIYYGKP